MYSRCDPVVTFERPWRTAALEMQAGFAVEIAADDASLAQSLCPDVPIEGSQGWRPIQLRRRVHSALQCVRWYSSHGATYQMRKRKANLRSHLDAFIHIRELLYSHHDTHTRERVGAPPRRAVSRCPHALNTH